MVSQDNPSKNLKHAGQHNILSIHIGQKRTKGKPTSSICIVVKVRKKLNPTKVQPKYRIPKRIKVGKVFIPIDVQVGKTFEPHARGGDFCGLDSKNLGAIGCFCYKLVTNPKTGEPGRLDLLLTNNHVIGFMMNADPHDEVFQFDESGNRGNIIAHGIKMGTVNPRPSLSIDAAIAVAEENPESEMNQHRGLRFNDTIVEARIGETVFMHGPRTRGTEGKVTEIQPSYPVPYTKYPINDTFQIARVVFIQSSRSTPFSVGGDSGSLIINANGNPVALLVAGEGNTSIAIDLLTVQNDLKFDGIHSVP